MISQVAFFIIFVLGTAQSCSPGGEWHKWKVEEVLTKAEIVVYGREYNRTSVADDDFSQRKDALFEVYCVLKNSDRNQTIPMYIPLYLVEPRHSCSGTVVNPNEDVILCIRRVKDMPGYYEWDEVNLTQNVAFIAGSDTQRDVSEIECLNKFVLPDGRTAEQQPTCPAQPLTHVYDEEKCSGSAKLQSLAAILIVCLFSLF